MARNDVVLLDSLVEKSKTQLGSGLNESELFEIFVFDQVLKDYDPSFEELESGWTDGGNDGGIDGFFIFIDDRIPTPDSIEYASKRFPRIDVHILSVRRSSKFEQPPIDTLISTLGELLDLSIDECKLKYPYNEYILQQRKLFSDIYIALADRQPQLGVYVKYCSRGDSRDIAPNLQSRNQTLADILNELFSNADIKVDFMGASELLSLARKQRDFTLRLPYIENYISREGRNYILLCTLSEYFKFISDSDGNLRRYLFESNVRDYLGEVQINRDIENTLNRSDSPEIGDFWWLNNGITILGTSASVAGKKLYVENVQIVNGLQTTETIHRFFSRNSNGADERAVLIKVILAADDEIRSRIIKATNYQNSVDLASLRGLDIIQHDIEEFLFDHGWFYDRRKNFYKNQGKQADRIISIPYLAAAVRAIALADPAGSQKQRSRSLRDDATYKIIFNPSWDLNVFLVSLNITRTIEATLNTRRRAWDTPPSRFVHYVGFVYTCESLGKFRYTADEVAVLVGNTPSIKDVSRISQELQDASKSAHERGRKYKGIKMSNAFIERFIREKFDRN